MSFKNPKNPLLRRQAAGQSAAAPMAAPTITKHASKTDEALFDESGEFNPRPVGKMGSRGIADATPASSGRIYNAQGEVNAYSKQDALTQVSYVLGNVTRDLPFAKSVRQASRAEKEERKRVLTAALNDPTGEGFSLVGQELLLPIKALIDYESWVRKVYRVRHLEQGELFRIPKDVRASAAILGQDGQGVESQMWGQYITPQEFKIASFPTVDMMEIWQLNFDVLDRAQDTARQAIEQEEDKAGVRLLDRASQMTNTVTSFTTLGVAALEAVRYQVERHRLMVDKFLINRQEVSDVQTVMSTQVDPVTQRELNMAGFLGSFMGAHVITSAGTTGTDQEVIPAGTFYAVTAPEYLGEMGIRIELFSEPFNKFAMRETKKGWAFVEVVGFGIPNTRSVAKGVKSA